MIESYERVLTNLEYFRRRLARNVAKHRSGKEEASGDADSSTCDTVEVSIVQAEGDEVHGKTLAISKRKEALAAHRWLDCVESFSSLLQEFWKKTCYEFDTHGAQYPREEAREDVVVAVIDDGVDVYAPSISDRIVGGRSLAYSGDRTKPFYVSESGHGTIMARLIIKVCPMAKLYPIRLKTHISTNGSAQIDVTSAALVSTLSSRSYNPRSLLTPSGHSSSA